jgi:hypothetical protein
MRIKEGHTIKTIGGEHVVIVQGRTGVDLTKIISFNAMAEWLWNMFSDIDFTENEVSDILMEQYGIGAGQATADAHQWIVQLSEARLLEL